MRKSKTLKEIVGCKRNGIVTLMFIDTILKDGKNLYHRTFYVGDERSECIDEKDNVYFVAIDKPEDESQELYDMINTTAHMLKTYFNYDFSKNQEFWLADEKTFADKSTIDEWNIRNRIFWNEV